MFEMIQGLVHLAQTDPIVMRDLIYYLEMAALEADALRKASPQDTDGES